MCSLVDCLSCLLTILRVYNNVLDMVCNSVINCAHWGWVHKLKLNKSIYVTEEWPKDFVEVKLLP
jgi:hypothetical protein